MLQTLEYLFTPIVAIYQISATLKGCIGAGELYLRGMITMKLYAHKGFAVPKVEKKTKKK